MFVDMLVLYCKAGDGGNGCMSFRREAHVSHGGPDGGDGGDGGSIIILADENVTSLGHLIGHKHWLGENGRPGMGKLMQGRSGEDSTIVVPPGTIIRDAERGNVLRDLARPGDTVVVAKGGTGGKGNKKFATSTHRAPREFGEGTPGDQRNVLLELKVIADVGLIGKPNAGKSTLLSRLSRAQPEIADYPFTTKSPNLGMVRPDRYEHEFVMADIPGLIEGAHAGVGLGHEFLRHVERTKVFTHLIEPAPTDQTDPVSNYRQIREELRLYNPLLSERPEIVCVSKCELPTAEQAVTRLREELGVEAIPISAVTGRGLPQLLARILEELERIREENS